MAVLKESFLWFGALETHGRNDIVKETAKGSTYDGFSLLIKHQRKGKKQNEIVKGRLIRYGFYALNPQMLHHHIIFISCDVEKEKCSFFGTLCYSLNSTLFLECLI